MGSVIAVYVAWRKRLEELALSIVDGARDRRHEHYFELAAAGRHPIDHGELITLALAEMPPTSLRLAMLEMAGFGTADALDKLGVRREHRARVIAGRAPILVQKPR